MNNLLNNASTFDDTVSVLIVGGSLVGLSISLFLARQGIRSLVVERHPGTAIHPRVSGLTARTMEIFRSAGIEEEIRREEPPFSREFGVMFVESLAGQPIDNLMEDMSAYFTALSPVEGNGIAQDLLEPVLRAQAEQAGVDVRYNTEMVSFVMDTDGISAVIRDRSSGNIRRVRAQYMVGADGSKSGVRSQLGIGQHGEGTLCHLVSMVFDADIHELFEHLNAHMCFFANETASGSLVLYPGTFRRPDLYRLDVIYDPDEETMDDYPEERCTALIRAAIGMADIPIAIRKMLTWEMAGRIADRFQHGRIFLVGDSARVQPPSGGLGGNTGIAEAHNLAWKLAAVLRGEAGPDLLSTYDVERRPIADYTVEQVIKLSQQRSQEGSEGITVNTLHLNMGYRYPIGAIVPEADGGDLPRVQSPELWRGQPGTRAAHIVLEKEGQKVSALDLFGARFVLLAGPGGHNVLKAAQRVQEILRLPMDIYRIGGHGADFGNSGNDFLDAYGITSTGGVLVRPDGYIGWRTLAAEESKGAMEQVLTDALSAILCR
ncbi:4-methyl-5-nitrocatechol 5-monooxygenase [Paenibacillus solanacearum]|uniref:4-methyl-5-nitrocatechol 5-monooxygenase n=1 Tax=Paenibacillus solanacearum TaxID=2048548 RepID=A0A916JYY2_9BACL|nr:FAD-dependent monooxygenase [Paenibacillus solanacearum]CAG7608881.1 4-methyl-5-nitrocatechol 5-monooxygenase [Paenibacillus solanacearum]